MDCVRKASFCVLSTLPKGLRGRQPAAAAAMAASALNRKWHPQTSHERYARVIIADKGLSSGMAKAIGP